MKFAPEKQYTNSKMEKRLYNEMNTVIGGGRSRQVSRPRWLIFEIKHIFV